MGPFSLITYLLFPSARKRAKSSKRPAGFSPRRLEKRRVLDGAICGALVSPLSSCGEFVQTGDNLADSSSEPASTSDSTITAAPLSVSIALSASEIFENDTVQASITIDDPSWIGTYSVEIDWGDGSPPANYSLPAGETNLNTSHQYLDDNPSGTMADTYTITVKVTSDLGETADTTVDILVRNVPPSIDSLTVNSPINEGGLALLEITYSNVGTQDTHVIDIYWGDGNVSQVIPPGTGSGSIVVPHFYLDDLPSGVSGTIYAIAVVLTDDDGGQSVATTTIRVNNVPPRPTIFAPVTVNEGALLDYSGGLLGFFFDPGLLDTHTATVDWGDGLGPQPAVVTPIFGGGLLSGTHTYLDNGVYTVTVVVTDDDLGVGTATSTVTVLNVAPTVALDSVAPINESQFATLSGTITDPGVLDTFTLDVHWGDPASPDNVQSFDLGFTSLTMAADGIDWNPTTRTFTVSRQYLDDNPTGIPTANYTISVLVTDKDGDQGSATTSVTVSNVAPTTTLFTPITVDEGSLVDLSGGALGFFTDPGVLDTHTATVDWGDGSGPQPVTVTQQSGGGLLSGTHTYLDNGVYTVTVVVTDDDLGVGTATSTVTVLNVAPTVALDSVAPINESQFATLSGTITDPGVLDTFTLDIHWGDPASPDNVQSFDLGFTPLTMAADGIDWNPATRTFTVSRQYLDDNPTGIPTANYTISVLVTDKDGDQGSATTSVTVSNVAPTTTLFAPITVDEGSFVDLSGGALGFFSDPGVLDTHTATVDWGDGSGPQPVTVTQQSGGGLLSATHTYLDNGVYTVTVVVTDDDLGVGTATSTVTVLNVAPTVTLDSVAPINENQFSTLSGTITDPGVLDTFTLDINWGDPASPDNVQSFDFGFTSLTMAADGIDWNPTTRTFTVSRQYLDDNPSGIPTANYTISVLVTDKDGDQGSATTSVTVSNVAPTLTLVGNQTVNEGALLNLMSGALGTFTDPGTLDTHTATVNWGDGSPTESVLVNQGSGFGTLSASHIYADDGVYTVTVTVTDDDGGSDTKSFLVTVLNVDPSLTGISVPIVVNEGDLITLSTLGVGLQDPGFDNPNNPLVPGGSQETFEALTVDWGDGSPAIPLDIATRTSGSPGIPTTATFTHSEHAYADDGVYTVQVVVRDDDGDFVTLTFDVTVMNVAPTLTLTDRVLEINEGETLHLPDLGTFTDPGFNNPLNPNGPSVESFYYTINWGDGTVETNQLPVVVNDGGPGVLTTGAIASSHFYADNSPTNLYTITVTLFDDDGGFDIQEIIVRVNNVNPFLFPVAATDVSSGGFTTLNLSFNDPGVEDTFEIWVDWGDQLHLAPEDRYVLAATHPGPAPPGAPVSLTLVHQYSGPPNPSNPAADIVISVKVRDKDFGIPMMFEPGESNVQTVAISNPGEGRPPISIDTTPQVPRLVFPPRFESTAYFEPATSGVVVQQVADLRTAAGDTSAASERYLELRVIGPDGEEGEGYRLDLDVLDDLPAFFRSLPDNHYALYLGNMENNSRRLVIEVYVRNGKVIDIADDSEGTRDRPPTDESVSQPGDKAQLEPELLEEVPPDPAAPEVEPPPQESAVSGHLPWGTVAVGLAATESYRQWAKKVDRALAKATVKEWRKLRLGDPQNRKNP